jgi:nucleotide-binding universal stress UspA family protein
MKTIIVPLDFSNESLLGLDQSIMLAQKTGANILMVHVLDIKAGTDILQKQDEDQLALIKFEEILKLYKQKNSVDYQINYIIKEGKVFREITELADKYEDSVIVLSTHGLSGFEELFIGGHAYKIASHSKRPVITVRKCSISSNIDRIVLPLDMTPETREKVPYTVKLAKLFNSEIHLVTVRSSKIASIEKKLRQYAEQVSYYLDSQGIAYCVSHLQGSNLTDITLEYAVSVKADLISIMTEQEMSVSNLLLGTYAHQMINKACIPVLSFPNYHLGILEGDFSTSGVV